MTDSTEKKQETGEVKSPKVTRRHFTKEFKERIVREAAKARGKGANLDLFGKFVDLNVQY
jgi:transposase-like protein